MNAEMFRLSLIELMNNDLLNDFVNRVFNYHLKDGQYIYMQYKIVHGNVILNIYDKRSINKFKAFIFTNEDIDNGDGAYYINIDACYKYYQIKRTKKKLYLLGALLKSNNNTEKEEIIHSIDNNKMKDILLKHFVV